MNLASRGAVHDAMTYDIGELKTWRSLMILSKTVWHRVALWQMLAQILMLSLIVAGLVLLIVRDPAQLKVNRFTRIATFFSSFVALLIGFFLSVSVHRWWKCAEGFLISCDAIRNLQVQLYSLGVAQDLVDVCLRYGVLSVWILHFELHIEPLRGDKEQVEATRQMWETLRGRDQGTDNKSILDKTSYYLTEDEYEVLKDIEDPSVMLWIWVGTFVGHLAQVGEIPPMQTPTYSRITLLASSAHSGMRRVRSSITVQAPLIYVHMLSSLVHINNLINALSFGLTLGASVGTLLENRQVPMFRAIATDKELARDIQSLLCSLFLSLCGPLIYQALLEVSICLAQPFSTNDAEVPTFRLLKRLQRDLQDGRFLAPRTPWQPPQYKLCK